MDLFPALDLTPALPEVILFVSGLILLAIGSFREEHGAQGLTPFAILAFVIVIALVVGVDKADTAFTFSGHFVFDGYAAFLKVVILIAAAASLVLSHDYLIEEKADRFEYPILVLFSVLGMSMMVSANSFLSLYMGLELQSLCAYVLASFQRDSIRSSEAGLKYFVLGALASGLLLYGCSLVYGFTGTLLFTDLSALFAGGEELGLGALVGLVFISAGLAFKLSAVPFHMWTPDVYEGAPTPVTAFLAAAPKLAAMGLIVRVLMQPFGGLAEEWQQIIVFISVASMGLGAFAAIGQTNIKRLMAYSGIGNVGYALVGLAAANQAGVYGVLVYMTIYVVMTIGAFACILRMRRQGRYVEQISDLSGLSRRQPLLAAAFAILLFSMAGVPPLAGFFGKFYVFMAAVEADLIALAVIGVLTSVVSCYYYLRVVKVMYFDEPVEAFDRADAYGLRLVAAGSAALMVVFILIPGPLFSTAATAAAALLN